MNGRRIATIGLALLVGLGGPALLLEWATRPAAPGAETAPGVLPWPYCAPDAPGPSFAPLAPRQGEDRIGPLRKPYTEALVPIRRLDIIEGLDTRDLGVEPPGIPLLIGKADAAPPIFQSKEAHERLGALTGGPSKFVGRSEVLREAEERARAGHEVVLGVWDRWDDALAVYFGLDLTTGEVLWSDLFTEEDRAYFLQFVRTHFPEASSGPALAELVVAWNREQEAPEGSRPISEAWGRFIAETFGVGYRELHGIPEPGTRAWWEQAPPLCRSLADAPPEVLAALEPVRVLVHVPRELPEPKDAVICLRLPLGTMPYCSAFRPNPEAEYLEFEAYTDGVNPLSVQVAHDTPRGISWVERVTVAEIPPELARSGTVLVRLDPALAGETYAEIAGKAEEAASTVGRLGETEDPLGA